MIVLHIGLPKTGSTFLQHKIFKQPYGDRFFHWKTSRNVRRLRNKARKKEVFATLAEWLRTMDDGHPSMITCENISSHGKPFWDGTGPSPQTIAEYLRSLRDAASIAPSDFRIILGVRRQDQMLASRYSQVADAEEDCSQEDFERRVRFILGSGSPLPEHKWLYYDMVKADFDECFGESNVFFFSQEALNAKPKSVVRRMGEFCALDFSAALQQARSRGTLKSVNKKSTGEDRWKLGNIEEGLFLPEDLKTAILDHFQQSNERFLKSTGSSLTEFLKSSSA